MLSAKRGTWEFLKPVASRSGTKRKGEKAGESNPELFHGTADQVELKGLGSMVFGLRKIQIGKRIQLMRWMKLRCDLVQV